MDEKITINWAQRPKVQRLNNHWAQWLISTLPLCFFICFIFWESDPLRLSVAKFRLPPKNVVKSRRRAALHLAKLSVSRKWRTCTRIQAFEFSALSLCSTRTNQASNGWSDPHSSRHLPSSPPSDASTPMPPLQTTTENQVPNFSLFPEKKITEIQ